MLDTTKDYFDGRELPFVTGFSYSQCIACPHNEDSFFTVMPIDYQQRILEASKNDDYM